MGEPDDRSLGKRLVEAGLVSPKQLQEALNYQKSIGGRLGRILVKLGSLREEKLLEFVAEQQGLEVMSLKGFDPDAKLMSLAPRAFWEKHGVVPVKVEHSTLKVAMSDASDIPAIDELRFTTSLEVVPVLAVERDIQTILNKHFYKDKEGDARRPRQHVDMREVARELEAKGTVKSDEKRAASEVLNANPAKLAKALAALLIERGVIDAGELSQELEKIT
ncbi:MAG TPA: hypothetical protein ENN09_00830 [Planctomycetes bacterium]|nr:hypothetical protein [Planctomycetota bacterium]